MIHPLATDGSSVCARSLSSDVCVRSGVSSRSRGIFRSVVVGSERRRTRLQAETKVS